MKRIWITWEQHRRTRELAAALEKVKLYELHLNAVRPIRYAWLLGRTLLLLIRETPDQVIVQNPSIVLALFMTTFGKLLTTSIVIDAHNEGLRPFDARYNRLLPLYAWIQRHADLTLVTNANLARVVEKNRGRAFVLPDKIPQFRHPRKIQLKGVVNIVFVCTFEKDEPFAEVIHSARFLGEDTHLYITGRYQKASVDLLRSAASNVTFTGFLSEQDYADLLFSCHAVMDLTLMQDCLVCGAYEAVSLEKPMILSDTPALRQFFHSGAVYTTHDAASIAHAVSQAADARERLQVGVRRLKELLIADWHKKIKILQNHLSGYPQSSSPGALSNNADP